ncbi:MAG: diguanylate cyclase, partial [Terriglobus sp.]
LDCLCEYTPYHRILFYRFLANWDGEVTHERLRGGVDTYLGLRFPASDIPENARRLFIANQHRVIMNVQAPAVPLLAAVGTAHQVNLTQSWLRAVHPAHLDYLRNMQVEASLTISIVVGGKLWGLIACHHSQPYCPSFKDRFGFSEIAELLSLQFGAVTELALHDERASLEYKLSPLLRAEHAEAEPRYLLAHHLEGLASSFRASGGWMRVEGQDLFTGSMPGPEARNLLLTHIQQERDPDSSGFISSETLAPGLRENAELVHHASGLLFLELNGSDFLVLLRPELVSTIHWAGERYASDGEGLRALSPRSSFLAWAEQVRFSATPWSAVELSVARQLREQVVLRIRNAQLARSAQHDPLTGLGNRRLFDQRLAQEFRKSAESNSAFALHLIDLDHFKEVNDRLGHAAGDETLREASARMQAILRSRDTLVRLGGDEFALIQTGVQTESAAAMLAGKIIDALSKPMQLAGEIVHVGASLGIALYPAHGLTRENLVHHADLALYSVKRAGRNGFAIYEPDIELGKTH